MAVQDNLTGPLKVFLWTTPRSASTTLLKCMTYVPDTVAWHEPYLQMGKFSLDGNPMFSEPHKKLLESVGGRSAVAKIESGYDASDKTLDWLKEQLEGEFPGKKLVFVKEIAAFIASQSLHDKIPRGFRHTFLIRHPSKIILSMIKHRQSPGVFKNPNISLDQLRPIQYLNALWKHVKAEGLESCPVIMDADELLANPKEMLEAYCKEVGIPFCEDLLTWPAGDDVMTKHWMVPKQTIATFRVLGFHTSTFASTGFQKSTSKSISISDQLNSQLPPEWAKVIDEAISTETPYYEELFAERLTPDKK